MKLKFTIIFFVLVCFSNLYAQNAFTKGYYIDVKNNRVECLIKDEDWDFNPTEFRLKTDENSVYRVISAKDFIEFGVNEYKFIKVNVKIDKSNDNYTNLSGDKKLNLVDDTLVLRVLIEGDANLYSYKNEKFTRFFYSINNAAITQLSFKIYNYEGGFAINNNYKQELLNSLKCDKITQNDIDRLEYQEDKLSDLFKEYNLCKTSVTTDFRPAKVINTLELYVKAGVSISGLNYENSSSDVKFGTKTKFRPAIEVEVNFSNRKKNVSILIDLSYQYYKGTTSQSNGLSDISVDYKAIDIAVGLRKYVFLNPKALLFFNGYMIYGFPQNATFRVNYNIDTTMTPAFGIGFLYNKRYTLDVRYDLDRDIIGDYLSQSAKYNTLSLNFGYKLF